MTADIDEYGKAIENDERNDNVDESQTIIKQGTHSKSLSKFENDYFSEKSSVVAKEKS
jgi:hypothetical protein